MLTMWLYLDVPVLMLGLVGDTSSGDHPIPIVINS